MNEIDNVFYWLPCSVVFVSTEHEDKRDIMTATAMFVSEKEPLLVISVAKKHLTEKLIDRSGRFTLVIAGHNQKQLAAQVGSLKGEETDKFEHFAIDVIDKSSNGAPVPAGSAAWMACEVEDSHEIMGYRIFIGRVVDQQNLGEAPLVWQKDRYFRLDQI